MPVQQVLQTGQRGRLLRTRGYLPGVMVTQFEREGQVFEHGHMRIERVVLEHHRDVALARRQRIDDPAVDQDAPVRDALEPGQGAQQGGLATAAGAHQHQKLAVRHRQVNLLEDLNGAERLAHLLECNGCHPPSPPGYSAA
jgi:hypothetical protein